MPVRSSGAIQILVAVPTSRVARRISETLLERRLCACAQTLGPVTSRYRWRGKIESAREWLLVVKTRAALFPAVERAVHAMHPYEVPEILAMPVEHGNSAYLRWLIAETSVLRPTARQRSTPRKVRGPRPPRAR